MKPNEDRRNSESDSRERPSDETEERESDDEPQTLTDAMREYLRDKLCGTPGVGECRE